MNRKYPPYKPVADGKNWYVCGDDNACVVLIGRILLWLSLDGQSSEDYRFSYSPVIPVKPFDHLFLIDDSISPGDAMKKLGSRPFTLLRRNDVYADTDSMRALRATDWLSIKFIEQALSALHEAGHLTLTDEHLLHIKSREQWRQKTETEIKAFQ